MQMRLGEKFLHLVSGDFPMPFDSGVDIVISSSFGYFAAQKTIAYDMQLPVCRGNFLQCVQ